MHNRVFCSPCRNRSVAALAVLSLVAGTASAQTEAVAWTADAADEFGFFNTDAGVGVNGDAIVSTANMRLLIFAKTGGTAVEPQAPP